MHPAPLITNPAAPRTTVRRIGAVTYLNSKPLVEGLQDRLPETEVVLDYPSRLADDLRVGQLDVALIPSIEYFRGERYCVVSDACVATHGPVRSVKLYSRVPFSEIGRLALDEGSRTSAALARILLAEQFGLHPERESLPVEKPLSSSSADAILLIGDRAMNEPEEHFAAFWDLGEEWLRWTGLPFVFALWAGRLDRLTASNPVDWHRISVALKAARDDGVANAESIARREAALLGLPVPTTIEYLTKNLYFHLGTAEQNGLRLYYSLAVKHGLAPEGVDLVFRD